MLYFLALSGLSTVAIFVDLSISHLYCFSVFQSGFKDGAYEGRQSVFQTSFDDGYTIGVRNGLQLGRYQGVLAALAQIQDTATQTPINDLLLVKPTRGQCQICTDKELINGTVDELHAIQSAHETKCQQALAKKYPDIQNFIKQT